MCIKICIDPCCEEIAHNINKKETHCRNCDMVMVEISWSTYWNKFRNNFFQYDYRTGELYKPEPKVKPGETLYLFTT